MNIFEKLSAITAELQTVGKNLTVGYGNNTYKAVSERDILDAVKPIEAKHGVYSYPYSREVIESNLLEAEKTVEKNGVTTTTKTTTLMTRIKTVYRFVNIEKPDEYIDTVTFAEGMDTQDKGSGKAMTYADKYALMKAYKLSTGEDPDQTASEPMHFASATPMPPRNILLAKLKELGLDVKEYAAAKGLDKNTPDSRYEELLKELSNG